MSDGIWNGDIGWTGYYCPFCNELWDDEILYGDHMSAHSPGETAAPARFKVTEIDPKAKTITIKADGGT